MFNQPLSKLIANNSITINSIFLYSISFVVTFLVHEFGLVLTGYFMGLDSIMYHNTMSFNNLTSDSQLIVFCAGPLSSLLLGTISLLIYLLLKKSSSNLRLFFIWLYINGFTLFLSQIPNLPFEKTGDLGKAISAMNLNTAIIDLSAILSLLLLILLGMYSVKPFLQYAATAESITTGRQRRFFIFKIGIIPWLLGAVFSFPFRIPPIGMDYLILPISNGMIIVWTYIGARGISLKKFDENGKNYPLDYSLIVIWFILLGIFQFILRPGINF